MAVTSVLDEDVEVRREIAEDPNTDADLLTVLATFP